MSDSVHTTKDRRRLIKLKYEALPQVLSVFIVVVGLCLNLFANIVHDSIKSFNNLAIYTIYTVIVALGSLALLLILFYWVRKLYMQPVEEALSGYESKRSKES